MNIKKLITLLIALLAMSFILSACGGETEEPEATAEPAATTAPAEEPTDEPMEEPTDEPMEEPTEEAMEEPDTFLTIWADDTRAPLLQELAEDFQNTYGVGLTIEQVGFNDIRSQFVIAAPAGEGPDIIIGAHDWLGELVGSGLLEPIELGNKAGQFTESSIKGFTYEGVLYGLPYAQENLAFFYNQDMVDGAPATWAEAMETGNALVESGDATYGLALTGTTYDAFPLLTAFGGYVFGQDDAGNYSPQDVGVGSEGMIAAGDFIAESVDNGFLSNSTDWDTAHVLFETGEIPYLLAGPWALDRIRESGVNYAISDFPDDGNSFAGVQGFMVNALSENVPLAQAFLTEFVATDDLMTAIYEVGNRPSAFTSVLEATDDPDIATFGEVGADAVLMPAIPEMGAVWGSWGDAITLILNGDESAESALSNAGAQITELIAGAAAGMINVPGSWQAAADVGCGDWAPDCEGTALTEDGDMYVGTFNLPAGDYEAKVALDGTWTVNYGVDGVADGDNYAFTVDSDSPVTFSYDPATNLLDIKVGE